MEIKSKKKQRFDETSLQLHYKKEKEQEVRNIYSDDANSIDLEGSKVVPGEEMTQATTYHQARKSQNIQSSRNCQYTSSDGLKLMSEVHDHVPQFGLEKVTFMNDSNYANEAMFSSSDEFDRILKNWDKDMPVGRGFIQLPDSEISDLPPPFRSRHYPERNGYSIASLHQLHCIYMIMRAFGDHRLGRPPLDDDMERHVTHCFDYLRQSAQCAGDATLEGVSATINHKTDGWGNTHVCKKNSELVKWVYDNRLSNYTGIH